MTPRQDITRCAAMFAIVWVTAAGMLSAGEPRPLRDVVDELIAASWQDREVTPAEPASDAEFLRRVYLDLAGTIPTAAEAAEFLDDATVDKRPRLVDRLLASPSYAYRMQTLFDVTLLERQTVPHIPRPHWQTFLRDSFAADKPYDQLVREILGSDGREIAVRPATSFYFARMVDSNRQFNANLITRDVGRLFLGVNLQCAQCHDHPVIEDYKQSDYYGIYAFTNRLFMFTGKLEDKPAKFVAEKPEGNVKFTSVFEPDAGEREANPSLPGAAPLPEPELEKGKEYEVAPAEGVMPVPTHSRRAQLARLLTSADNRAFARNIVNRLWGMMMGRGLVHPYDLHHADNAPSHPELLDALAGRFAAEGFKIKPFLRELALSKTYQLSSIRGARTDDVPEDSFCVAPLKPLWPSQLALALMQATGFTDVQRAALGEAGDEARLREKLSPHFKEFAPLYGSPSGQPESKFLVSPRQALFLANNELVLGWTRPTKGNLVDRLGQSPDTAALARGLYLSIYARVPEADETAAVAEHLTGRDEDRATALVELVWAMLASAEFRFNH